MVVGGVHGCREACMVAGVCVIPGGMCGCGGGGACVVAGGHAWLLGGMHGCGGCYILA